MVDIDALEEAGIANARQRIGLLTYLDSLGFSVAEMVEADRSGRLFGLAGDVLQWTGPPLYSVRTAAESLGVPADDVARAWTLLGLNAGCPDEVSLSQADVDALTTWIDMKKWLGDTAAFSFLRTLGSVMARLAEAESAVTRARVPDIQIHHTRDELATAQAYRAAAAFLPRIGALIDVVHRHHMVSARTHFERVIRDSSASVVCGVGFADISGFTALTQRLTPTELSVLLNEFSATVSDVLHADGGRIVKFIGDEVMWVSAAPHALAEAATHLVNHPRAFEVGLRVRAGLGWGDALAINGDYFGIMVNLAARLVGAARPGQILASEAMHGELPDWPATVCEPLMLKGFDTPVVAYELHRAG